MKNIRALIALAVSLAAIAATVVVVIAYKDEICGFFCRIKEKAKKCCRKEYDDFADVGE